MELAESELFGHEAGAFSGAQRRKRGLLELAEGGTLLLNELGELSLALQAKLLTFLDTKTFTRVGGEKNITVNARIIAATNKDIEQEVAEGRFRGDLYFRLNVLTIRVPCLRDRVEDIPILVDQIVSHLVSERNLPIIPTVDPSVKERLCRYNWPGNVRELRNVIERALILSEGGPLAISALSPAKGKEMDTVSGASFPEGRSLNQSVRDFKLQVVKEAIRRCAGNKTHAARLLGISRSSIMKFAKALE
jgi:DNA-binding NtrC family response regulator